MEAAPPSAGRDLLLVELALAQLALGGTAQQIAEGTRIRWTPGGGGRQPLNEKTYTVQQELQTTLKAMATASADVRFHAIRRLARELARAGQPEVLSHSLIAQVMPQEHAEAVAQAAVETLKATGDQARRRPRPMPWPRSWPARGRRGACRHRCPPSSRRSACRPRPV